MPIKCHVPTVGNFVVFVVSCLHEEHLSLICGAAVRAVAMGKLKACSDLRLCLDLTLSPPTDYSWPTPCPLGAPVIFFL